MKKKKVLTKAKPVQMHTTKAKAKQSDVKSESKSQEQILLTLDELVAGITEQNRYAEADFGPAVGNEVW